MTFCDFPPPSLPVEALLVLGMHRSGTSFLGECCGALGYALPRDAGGPAEDNPRGHFEPRAIVDLNDAILAEAGAVWDRIGAPAQPEADEATLARLDRAVRESFGEAGRVVIKDPRLSMLMPLWRAWLDARGIRAAVLVALRDPRAVARSLMRRDGLSADSAMLSWMGHTLEALDGAQGLPTRLILFPDWTGRIDETLAGIAALSGSGVPPDAAARVREHFLPGAVHDHGNLEPADSRTGQLAMSLFDDLAAAARQGEVPDAATLAGHRRDFEALSAPARGVEASHARRHLAARSRLAELDARRAALEADVAARLADTRALQQRVRDTEEQRDRAQMRAEESHQDALELMERVAATEAQRHAIAEDAARRIADAEAQRDAARAAAEAAHRDARALMDQVAATEAQRDHMMAVAEAHAQGLEEAAHRAELQEANMAELRRQLDHARAHIESSDRLLAEMAHWLERERVTVLKPIYRRLYRLGGRTLRGLVPAPVVEQVKRRLPVPGGIPRGLAFSPLPSAALPTEGYGSITPRNGDKPDVFVLSIINWDFRTQRPQHLATEMAAAGHRVFYVEMERDQGNGSARQVAPGVQVIRLPGRGMRMLASYTGVPSPAQARAWVDHFHAFADAVGAGPVAHVVVEHPYWWHLVRHLSPEYQITFDCMDDIGGFSNTEPHVLEAEMQMIAQADKMIVSSQYLNDKFGAMRDVVMVRNGTDVSHFIREPEDEPAPEFLRGRLKKDGIRVGYVGAIAEWFDTDLLEQVARENPDFDIHLCGAVTAEPPLRLGKLPNVTLHGEIPYRDVPAFHKQMDVLIIPFQLLPIIKACDPVKFYEYSAVMRPTVATALPELERAGDLVFTAGTAPDFAAAIRRAAPMARDPEFGQRLRQYALDNAWSFRAADLLAEMNREPKLSVVVLHYGDDTELTLASLHAMLGRGQVYPNLEVVLVDNGSSDEVLAVLRQRAAADPRIVLVENGENLGFAGGNNRGIAAATGEYVLLLNNDTFLAPGALLAMVRHLQRNPQVGIVGPMTNSIGNEARVEIAYADMDEMVRAARALATGHRGQWTPIAVCAYFCAMFRRADLDRLGHLPEIYGRGMFEDDDHCATFRAAGLQMALAEDAFCHHQLSASFDALPSGDKQALFLSNKAIFEGRWGAWVPHVYRDSRPTPTLAES